MSDKVCVIITTESNDKGLDSICKSLLNSTYTNLKILIVDNCGSDLVKRTIEKNFKDLAEKYPIVVISNMFRVPYRDCQILAISYLTPDIDKVYPITDVCCLHEDHIENTVSHFITLDSFKESVYAQDSNS